MNRVRSMSMCHGGAGRSTRITPGRRPRRTIAALPQPPLAQRSRHAVAVDRGPDSAPWQRPDHPVAGGRVLVRDFRDRDVDRIGEHPSLWHRARCRRATHRGAGPATPHHGPRGVALCDQERARATRNLNPTLRNAGTTSRLPDLLPSCSCPARVKLSDLRRRRASRERHPTSVLMNHRRPTILPRLRQ